MLYFKFDYDKAIATILLIANKLIENFGPRGAGFHKVFKMLYFAEQKHLVKYGRPIVGDFYIAMEHGPVPSRIYDMIKIVKGESLIEDHMNLKRFFDVKRHFIYPKQEPDMDEFSESDLECIEESLKENQSLTFNQLKQISHDSAYKKALKDDKIAYSEIAKSGGAEESILHFMRIQSENERLLNQ
ncbi:MAG: SocA family protein [Deltaproteobacteria bacterium]|nr:SocA family protein [Deltaproteobacteria bacterium]